MISCFPSTGSIDVCRGSQQFVDLVLYWQWFLGSTHSMLTVVYCIWMESCSSCHGTADLCGGQRLASVVELRAAGTSRCSSSLFVWFLYMKCSSGTLRKEASFLGCLPVGLTGNNQTEMPHIVKMSSECSNCSFNGTEQRSQLEAESVLMGYQVLRAKKGVQYLLQLWAARQSREGGGMLLEGCAQLGL
nr:uncharacterized protein LOC125182451 isoform X4 [Anser cygnoides]